jgi:indole-3-glycerol phosphate synthase
LSNVLQLRSEELRVTRLPNTGTILDRIMAQTKADVEARRHENSLATLQDRIDPARSRVSLISTLSEPGLGVIAEIKRGSPSKGLFPVEVDAAAVARDYLAGGADAISVLTDEPFFFGSLADLEAVTVLAHRPTTQKPVLRKDFIFDEYQFAEAALAGADAILLIVAALEQATLRALIQLAPWYHLDALVEVHDERELDVALEHGARLIGINNRDLRTFGVDLSVSERVARRAPDDVVLVGESGIFTHADAQRMIDAGLDAVLVGESLILAEDRSSAIGHLKSVKRPATTG